VEVREVRPGEDEVFPDGFVLLAFEKAIPPG
jgi:hypothetical protein